MIIADGNTTVYFTPGRPPYAVGGRIPLSSLTGEQLARLRDWLTTARIDPARIDEGSLMEADGGEWRIGLRRPGGGYVIVRRVAPDTLPLTGYAINLDNYLIGGTARFEPAQAWPVSQYAHHVNDPTCPLCKASSP